MRQIDIQAMVSDARLNAFHYRVLIWCALIIVFDGTLVGFGLPLEQNFMSIAVPGIVAAAAVLMINHAQSASVAGKQGNAAAVSAILDTSHHPAHSKS